MAETEILEGIKAWRATVDTRDSVGGGWEMGRVRRRESRGKKGKKFKGHQKRSCNFIEERNYFL